MGPRARTIEKWFDKGRGGGGELGIVGLNVVFKMYVGRRRLVVDGLGPRWKREGNVWAYYIGEKCSSWLGVKKLGGEISWAQGRPKGQATKARILGSKILVAPIFFNSLFDKCMEFSN